MADVEEEEAPFDFERVREWFSYGRRAIVRRPLAFLFPAALVAAAALVLVWAIPNRYFVTTKLLAPRPDLIAILANPGRPLSADARANTRAVTEILRRDNLLAAIRQTGLVEQWRATRPPHLRLKDRLLNGRELGDDELREVLVATLERRLVAWSEPQDDGSGSLTVGLTWNDPQMAIRLLNAIVTNFQQFRETNELAIMGESIALLEERQDESRRDLEEALAGSSAQPGGVSTARRVAPAAGRAPTQQTVELARLRSNIASKRRALDDMTSFKARKVMELQAQLAEQRATYSETHPYVANTKRSLEALSADPPQLTALRQEIGELESRYVSRGGGAADLTDGLTRGAGSAAFQSSNLLERALREPVEDYQRSRLAAAAARYYGIVDRLEGARLERDAARANAKYRYVVVTPPLPPRAPSNRMGKLALLTAGVLGGIFLGVLVAVGTVVRSGRLVQRWQVERSLGLPILAEMPRIVQLPRPAPVRGKERTA